MIFLIPVNNSWRKNGPTKTMDSWSSEQKFSNNFACLEKSVRQKLCNIIKMITSKLVWESSCTKLKEHTKARSTNFPQFCSWIWTLQGKISRIFGVIKSIIYWFLSHKLENLAEWDKNCYWGWLWIQNF